MGFQNNQLSKPNQPNPTQPALNNFLEPAVKVAKRTDRNCSARNRSKKGGPKIGLFSFPSP